MCVRVFFFRRRLKENFKSPGRLHYFNPGLLNLNMGHRKRLIDWFFFQWTSKQKIICRRHCFVIILETTSWSWVIVNNLQKFQLVVWEFYIFKRVRTVVNVVFPMLLLGTVWIAITITNFALVTESLFPWQRCFCFVSLPSNGRSYGWQNLELWRRQMLSFFLSSNDDVIRGVPRSQKRSMIAIHAKLMFVYGTLTTT